MRGRRPGNQARPRRAPRLPVAVAVLAATLGMAACGSASETAATASSAARSSAAVAVPAGGASADVGVGRCAATDLTVSLGPASRLEGDQRERSVVLTNRSSRRCAVSGYPGASLVTQDGTAWDLERSPLVSPTRIVLAPGGTAHAALRYLPADPGVPGAFEATRILITPPETTTPSTLTWDDGPLLDQSGATHPGTYLLALQPG
ncbi:DUF4232 domain-containing protein [Frankia sp. Ag45/Mut15]|uniref:DUF4232 domain-containing protein n=1 Tax=Frankia umida TaxID=573489 RepID=A0ABT0JYU3_9ACTN|nr:DUF4232 domain-containing protein [Frankia umida]MCK9876724.1 DUF4232 domain-containing protein [Frankia umida]